MGVWSAHPGVEITIGPRYCQKVAVLLNKVQQKERFSPQMATDGIPKLDYVIDLTYTKRYYSPHVRVRAGYGRAWVRADYGRARACVPTMGARARLRTDDGRARVYADHGCRPLPELREPGPPPICQDRRRQHARLSGSVSAGSGRARVRAGYGRARVRARYGCAPAMDARGCAPAMDARALACRRWARARACVPTMGARVYADHGCRPLPELREPGPPPICQDRRRQHARRSGSEFQSRGIGHSKIATEGHVIPNGAVMRRFFDTMDSYLADDRRTGVIGVHCTHGVNRTGYMVCRYMISKLGFAPDQAIAAFNKARGHDLERANYLMDLRAGNWPELPEAVPEEPPEPAVESDRRREPWTPADQRRQRREERRRGAAPFPRPPPAGHRWHRPPGPPRFWRPPPPWAGPDWRPRGPPPPWVWPGGGEGWRHGPPPPRPPHHDDGPSGAARDGPPQDTGDQWQPEPRPVAADDPAPSAERPPPSADRGHDRPVPTGTRVLSIASERCPLVVETGEAPEVIVLSRRVSGFQECELSVCPLSTGMDWRRLSAVTASSQLRGRLTDGQWSLQAFARRPHTGQP
ncbi:Tyrosine-protein phosphatase [Amphibalanus amphitrite]|uniref:Tyrosine-protein phosphatase n=1 Tax=Amphibalanus amphitrite TaxID=1232801 RepID=A0A6A4V0E5_AMPAM|nr:Tyrosine-protein phosphatase [Amphibalanus amphitrite]